MIHCIYCGKALEDDAAFCSACGKRVILENKESGQSASQGFSGAMALDAMLAKESESPSAELEWQIGDSYFSGTNGASKDYSEAVRWLEKTSSREHPAACNPPEPLLRVTWPGGSGERQLLSAVQLR